MGKRDKKRGDVLSEDRWSCVYKVDEGHSLYESKFASGKASVSLDEVERNWGSWNERERLSFADAFSFKPEILLGDQKILDFLMQRGSESVSVVIALSLTRHPDKDKAKSFLLKQFLFSSETKVNFIQALGLMGGPDVILELRKFYDRAFPLTRGATQGTDRGYILEFLYCCAALWRNEKSVDYEEGIKFFRDHKDEIVRSTVAHLLRLQDAK